MTTYKFGDTVASVACGSKPAFVGVVTFVAVTGKSDPFFHVRDDDGMYWHRSVQNLTMVEPS